MGPIQETVADDALKEEVVSQEGEAVDVEEQASVEELSKQQRRKPRARPTYLEMIADAIRTQKKKTGSSRVAISKHIQENYANLPLTFEANLKKQLKNLVEEGKLYYDRVHKRSYKLSKKALSSDDFAAKTKRQKTQ